jgi:hypothetical protein
MSVPLSLLVQALSWLPPPPPPLLLQSLLLRCLMPLRMPACYRRRSAA